MFDFFFCQKPANFFERGLNMAPKKKDEPKKEEVTEEVQKDALKKEEVKNEEMIEEANEATMYVISSSIGSLILLLRV
jgi:hypothetical protein